MMKIPVQNLSKICSDKLAEKTSDVNAKIRLQQELDYIAKNEVYAEVLAVTSELVSYSRELGYYSRFMGSLGSSLIAFLLGITEIDPLKYNLPAEVFMRVHDNKPLHIEMIFDKDFIPILKQYVRENYPHLVILDRCRTRRDWLVFSGDVTNWNTYGFDTDSIVYLGFHGVSNFNTSLKELSELTGVDTFSIPFDDEQAIEVMKTFGIGDDDKEPDKDELWRRSITRMVNPKTFDEFVQTDGWIHSTYTCEQKDIPNMPAFREDVFLYLLHSGIDRVTACGIMERAGKWYALTEKHVPEYISAMLNAGISKQYIDNLNQIRYLWTKAHSICGAMPQYRRAWFKAHYPEEFREVMSRHES